MYTPIEAIKKPTRSKLVKVSFKKIQAMRADVEGIKKKN